ncbi:MAG: RNA chaperone Hfq [Pseudomonadota bacterium]
MADKFQNVQDVFLNAVRKEKMAVTVFLVNGVKLQGIITWFDNFSILLRRDSHVQLIYKHAVSTIMPGGPLNLNTSEDDATDDASDEEGGDE